MHRSSYFIVLLAAVLWGTTGTAQSYLPEAAHPLTIGAYRLAIGGFSLLVVLMWMKKVPFKEWPWKPTIIAAICMALFQPLFFSSVRLTGIAVGTVVAIGSAPIFSGFLEWFFMKSKPSRPWIVATAMSIVGCILLFLNKGTITVHPLGVTLSLFAGFAFAVYTIVSKQVLSKAEPLAAVAMTFSMSAVLLLPSLLFFDSSWVIKSVNIPVILYLGWMTTTVAYILFLTGLRHVPSSAAVTLSLGEPLTAALLGVFFIGEVLSVTSWVGVLLLLGGIVAITFTGRQFRFGKWVRG